MTDTDDSEELPSQLMYTVSNILNFSDSMHNRTRNFFKRLVTESNDNVVIIKELKLLT